MKIKEHKVKIRDVYEGYEDNDEEGVTGYSGRLDIRPKYQREFIYNEKERNEVVRTVMKGLPLNVMYWCKTNDGNYEVMDGQQRTISLMRYVDGDYSVDEMYFWNLPSDKQAAILDYELFIYICEGSDSEKLEWFRIINIAGEKLYDQELRNAIYAGTWTASAKKYFSKTNCPAARDYGDYLKGKSLRQDYLEDAISWIADSENTTIDDYMAKHQDDQSAVALWNYFSSVLEWVKSVFPVYRKKEMQGLPWGLYYNKHGQRTDLDPKKLEGDIARLMQDDEIQKKSGIYEYLLNKDSDIYADKALNLRSFSDSDKRAAYEQQKGVCPICHKHFEIEEMEGDHITPWSQGGKTEPKNCQMLCRQCNRIKSNK